MYRIIERNLMNNSKRVFKAGLSKSIAERYVKEFNQDSLYDNKFYSIELEDTSKDKC